MTVANPVAQTTLYGNGALDSFSFLITAVDAQDFSVAFIDTDGTQTPLTTSQYTITLNSVAPNQQWSTGGFLDYPLSGPPIPNGTALIITRTVPITQETTILNQGPFYAQAVERAIDILSMEVAQVSARTGQLRGVWVTGVFYNYGDVVQDGINGNDTGNYYTCAVANTSNVWQSDVADGDWSLSLDIQAVEEFAIAAAASAAAALVSENTAAASAGNASVSAGAAQTSASAAAVSAAAALASQGTASTAASNALTSANNAAASELASANSAGSAAASAVTATTQAGIATTQAGIATTQAGISTTQAIAAAASAGQAAGEQVGTSATSNAVGTGSKSYTTQTGLALAPGKFVTAAQTSNPANYNHGQVTSYSGTSLVINVLDTGGSGTFTDWTITTSAPAGPAGIGAGTVSSGTSGRLTYYAATGDTVSGNSNATISNGALTLGQAASVQGSLILSGSVSSTTTLAAPTTGTGTMSLQAGTDTIVGRATTDTLTNKTITASSNVLGGVTVTMGSDAQGDIYYRNGSGILTRLARGTANQVLHGGASIPAYSAVVEADITLADNTTNNVVSTRHGFAPKSPANAAQFLNGAATPAYAAVKDSDLATTDITTNNATAAKHGFLPKLSNSATDYLNGVGAWTPVSTTGNQPQLTVFTSSGTFTTSANITAGTVFKFVVTGGGGGGGGSLSGNAGGGGGAGATAIYVVAGLTASTGYTVTIGAAGSAGSAGSSGGSGGASSVVVGVTTVTGGGGGGGEGNSSAGISGAGGAGGTATNGAINILGGSGGAGISVTTASNSTGGLGGSSSFGGGGRGYNVTFTTPQAGQAYGSGGGGCGFIGAGGAAGKSGIVTVEWQE